MSGPLFLLVSGINGAGKSTLADEAMKLPSMVSAIYLNPGRISADLRTTDPGLSREAGDFEALRRVATDIRAFIQARQSFVSETVIVGPAYRRHVDAARRAGFIFRAIFVGLRSPEQAIERVALRVGLGGHSIPDATVRRRWNLVHDQVAWLAEQADRLDLYSNASGSTLPTLIGNVVAGRVEQLEADALPAVTAALRHLPR